MQRKIIALMIVTFLVSMNSFTVFAQNREEEKKKQEKLILERQLEAEKKAIEEEREVMVIKTEEMEKAVREAREAYRDIDIPDLPDAPMFFSTGTGRKGVYFVNGSQNSSSLQLTKNLKEASFTKEYDFEIEEEARHASINVSGICEEGEILVKITQPSGKTYTEVLIDEYGSVNWSKSFSIDEDDSSQTGKWVFQIVAREATGNFRLSLRSN
ncbi:MAG: hypothetical protein U5K32_11265 [Bacteroidales bacterium]|nr:hypothetical protein [Bacteroidales bacterium]